MTVFCPNCGKPNTDEATNCAACGHELKKGAGAKKFKGTMMMATPPGAKGGSASQPAPPAGASASQPAPAQPASAPTAPGAPAPTATKSEPAPGAPVKNLAFQKTMLGPMVAPPVAGPAAAPPAGGPPAAAAPPPQARGIGTAPTVAGPITGGFGTPAAPQSIGQLPPSSAGQPAAPAPTPAPFGAPPTAGMGGASVGHTAPRPAFGQGAPPAARPPMGGAAPGEDPERAKKKKILFIALGCLGVLVLFCFAACAYLVWKGKEITEEATDGAQLDMNEPGAGMDPLVEKLARVPLSFLLASVVNNCKTDPSGESSAPFFHPTAFGKVKGSLCTTAAAAADTYLSGDRSRVSGLAAAGEGALATALSLDPNDCFLFSSDAGRIVTCRDESNATKIVVYEQASE